jgi:hypothetical protein
MLECVHARAWRAELSGGSRALFNCSIGLHHLPPSTAAPLLLHRCPYALWNLHGAYKCRMTQPCMSCTARVLHRNHGGVLRGGLFRADKSRPRRPNTPSSLFKPPLDLSLPQQKRSFSQKKFTFTSNPETSFLERIGLRRREYQQERSEPTATMASNFYLDGTPDEVKNAKGLHLITMSTPNGQGGCYPFTISTHSTANHMNSRPDHARGAQRPLRH